MKFILWKTLNNNHNNKCNDVEMNTSQMQRQHTTTTTYNSLAMPNDPHFKSRELCWRSGRTKHIPKPDWRRWGSSPAPARRTDPECAPVSAWWTASLLSPPSVVYAGNQGPWSLRFWPVEVLVYNLCIQHNFTRFSRSLMKCSAYKKKVFRHARGLWYSTNWIVTCEENQNYQKRNRETKLHASWLRNESFKWRKRQDSCLEVCLKLTGGRF